MALVVETAVLLVAILMIVWSVYQMSAPIMTSPWLMPLLMSATMAMVAIGLIVGEIRRHLDRQKWREDAEYGADFVRPSIMRVIAWLALATGYALVTPWVGFEIATLVFLTMALRLFGKAGWLLTVVIAVGMAFLVPFIFRHVFHTLVP